MTRILSLCTLTLLVLAAALAAPAAASDHSGDRILWSAGVDFAVGGVDFSLGFVDREDHHGRRGLFSRRSHDRHPHRSEHRSYYYVTLEPLASGGHECGAACFLHDGRYYHRPDCSLVLEHFDRHGFDPLAAWSRLPDGGVAFYPLHHEELHDRHHGRRGGRRGRRGGSWDDDGWDSHGHRRGGGHGRD